MEQSFKEYCLLGNGEVRSCYPYDYKKKCYDYSKPLVRENGDHYVYVEQIPNKHFTGVEVLHYIEKFMTLEELCDNK